MTNVMLTNPAPSSLTSGEGVPSDTTDAGAGVIEINPYRGAMPEDIEHTIRQLETWFLMFSRVLRVHTDQIKSNVPFNLSFESCFDDLTNLQMAIVDRLLDAKYRLEDE